MKPVGNSTTSVEKPADNSRIHQGKFHIELCGHFTVRLFSLLGMCHPFSKTIILHEAAIDHAFSVISFGPELSRILQPCCQIPFSDLFTLSINYKSCIVHSSSFS